MNSANLNVNNTIVGYNTNNSDDDSDKNLSSKYFNGNSSQQKLDIDPNLQGDKKIFNKNKVLPQNPQPSQISNFDSNLTNKS